ncbi:MAG: esterase family protein [Chitinophagaceae bacterium]|jgi:S-formylglutathione hydrolase FrmB|nr:esterase family protein [Chitinophagaceae bacterium]MCA6474486.1 esterase family protein [Chitinophagaceae bacterium]MCA6483034.1 esterase family protein [Chitinophagaceae bacterium]MCA6491832.1 esterase family protein [Chitinophagaceae bacterium]MCA6495771.1 esterase family protein [Chitinophagaceae bacterium]
MKKILLYALLACLPGYLLAADVDTIQIYSRSMQKSIPAVVVTPDGYSSQPMQRYPVVYLLHGAGGSYSNWIKKVPAIRALADQYQAIIVCPDGASTSWYFDSPIDSGFRYETHVAREVPNHIDSAYRTINERRARAITGLSMGGHGALFIAFRHADRFSIAGSMSGALHVSVIRKGYNVEKRLGDTVVNAAYWRDWSVLNVIEQYPKDSLSILIDCGTEDRVIPMNRAVHEKMLKLKIPHEYLERPGEHNWPYWENAIQYQMMYINQQFRKKRKG